jgi:hypothetical protein
MDDPLKGRESDWAEIVKLLWEVRDFLEIPLNFQKFTQSSGNFSKIPEKSKVPKNL